MARGHLVVDAVLIIGALGCEAELEWLRAVAVQGASANRQLAVFAAARGDARQALSATVDWIAATTAGTAS